MDLKYDKKDYLASYLEVYFDPKRIDQGIIEYERLLKNVIQEIASVLKDLELALDGDSYYQFLEVLAPLFHAECYEDIKCSLDIKLPRLPKNSDNQLKKNKERIKQYLEELSSMCLFENRDEMIKDYCSTKNDIQIIIELIQKLDDQIWHYKNEMNAFEFVDISKLAIDLVVQYPDIREELKNYFKEIMIDEYQDTSDLQEQFIHLIENHNTR